MGEASKSKIRCGGDALRVGFDGSLKLEQDSVRICLIVLLAMAIWTAPALAEDAALKKSGRWTKVSARTTGDLRGFRPHRVKLSKYGGLASGAKRKVTGFFRTEKIGGRWWLVDPEGHLFLSVGLCSVNLTMFKDREVKEAFDGREAWVQATAKLLRAQGFNTLGRWSDAEHFRKLDPPMAYTTTSSFMGAYAKKRDRKNGERGFPHECQPVFDPKFATFCDRHAQKLAATKDDPWLLGHFTDNEIPFRPEALRDYLKLPKEDPGHQAARKFLAKRHKSAKQINKSDEADFLTIVAERYYSTVVQAIKKHDPNHLVIGSRLNGRNINDSVFRGSKPLDVISINYYHHWSADHKQLSRATALSGRPILQSEWYANVDEANAGFLVKTQRDRGLFYTNHTLSLLEDRNCVGWHWFKYGTQVDKKFQPFTDMTDLMKRVNEHVYALADHLMR